MPSPFTLTGFADEAAPDLKTQIEALEECGLSWIDLRVVNGKNVLDLTEDEIHESRARLDSAGIRVSAIGSPIGKVPIDSDLEHHFDRFKTAVRRARDFGTRYVRLFSFHHKGVSPEDCRDTVIAEFKRMTAYAEQEGIVLLHENEKGIYGDIPERFLDILQTIDSPFLRGIFDPANFVQCGVKPGSEAWPLLDPYIDFFHIKDALLDNRQVVPAGKGDGDIPRILTEAAKRGFTGFLSVEHHLNESFGETGRDRFRLAVDTLKDLLRKIGQP